MVVRFVRVTLSHWRRLKFTPTLASRTLTGKMRLLQRWSIYLQTEKFTLRLEPVLELAVKAYAVTLLVDKLRQ